jgi:ankyrin repeat protein
LPILLIHGAAANRKDPDGVTPLIRAVRNSDAETAGMLLGHGADPNLTDPAGWTPLHHACTRANPGVVERLLAAGAKTTLKHGAGKTPAEVLAIAIDATGKASKGQLAIAELLKKR